MFGPCTFARTSIIAAGLRHPRHHITLTVTILHMDRRAFLRASLEGNLTEPQLRQVHNILTAHIPEQIVTIFNDADQFRPLLIPKLNDGDSFGFPGQSIPSQELYVNLTMRTTPPRQAFIAVLEEFRHGRLKVAPITGALAAVTPPLHVDRFGTSEVRWRLFTDVTHRDILPTKIKRFGSRELLYNEHEAAWKLFRVIVEDYGHILNSVSGVALFYLVCSHPFMNSHIVTSIGSVFRERWADPMR
ncbi:hypothetical protein DL93DRAFT_1877046 [Clavulina sp. PMI_390]|nr:hypothetical protein DL93DRAFT_1877046 [Clavulina sp. PMI_390]